MSNDRLGEIRRWFDERGYDLDVRRRGDVWRAVRYHHGPGLGASPLAFGASELEAAEGLYAMALRSEAAGEAARDDPDDSLLHYEFRIAFDEEPDGSFTATLVDDTGAAMRMEQGDTFEDALLEVMAHAKPPSQEVRRARRNQASQ